MAGLSLFRYIVYTWVPAEAVGQINSSRRDIIFEWLRNQRIRFQKAESRPVLAVPFEEVLQRLAAIACEVVGGWGVGRRLIYFHGCTPYATIDMAMAGNLCL
jgi:hypothetical protein